jgi:solute carrier family 34 (sodium-dependent phosphate cotransporter)
MDTKPKRSPFAHLRRMARPVGSGLVGLALFVYALGLMKEGAEGLAPLLRDWLRVDGALDALGFGWLMAYVIQSGSPVAAAAMSLLSVEIFTPVQCYMAVAGSRIGAGLMVLQLGVIYTLRGHKSRKALSAGILSLLLTGSVMVVSLPLGLLALEAGWLAEISIPGMALFADVIDLLLKPVVAPLAGVLPGWALFALGVGVVTLSFQLIDRALNAVDLKTTTVGEANRLIYRPPVMFLLGFLVTLLTMSVSISLGILVPLSARGYVRRENMIPYVMGANISTLVDTLAAAALLGDPQGITVVLIHMLAGALISLLVIILVYTVYVRAISGALRWITRKRWHFAFFVGVIFLIPLFLILL